MVCVLPRPLAPWTLTPLGSQILLTTTARHGCITTSRLRCMWSVLLRRAVACSIAGARACVCYGAQALTMGEFRGRLRHGVLGTCAAVASLQSALLFNRRCSIDTIFHTPSRVYHVHSACPSGPLRPCKPACAANERLGLCNNGIGVIALHRPRLAVGVLSLE